MIDQHLASEIFSKTTISMRYLWSSSDKGKWIIARYFIEKKDNLRERPDMNPFSFSMDFHYQRYLGFPRRAFTQSSEKCELI